MQWQCAMQNDGGGDVCNGNVQCRMMVVGMCAMAMTVNRGMTSDNSCLTTDNICTVYTPSLRGGAGGELFKVLPPAVPRGSGSSR